jgi:hypothetical protein
MTGREMRRVRSEDEAQTYHAGTDSILKVMANVHGFWLASDSSGLKVAKCLASSLVT